MVSSEELYSEVEIRRVEILGGRRQICHCCRHVCIRSFLRLTFAGASCCRECQQWDQDCPHDCQAWCHCIEEEEEEEECCTSGHTCGRNMTPTPSTAPAMKKAKTTSKKKAAKLINLIKTPMYVCVTTREKSDSGVNVKLKKKLTLLENYECLG